MLHFYLPLIFLSFLWMNFPQQVMSQTSNAVFTSPTDGSTEVYNSVVTVIINFNSVENPIITTQTCTFPTSTQTINILRSSPSAVFNLPANYIGRCTYSGVEPTGLRLRPVTITVIGTASFVLPSAGTRAAAGSTTPVKISYAPILADPPIFSTKLYCPNNGLSSVSDISGSTELSFPIPSNFYGSDCYFQATNVNFPLIGNSLNITVTQPLTFLYPAQNTIVVQPSSLLINLQSGAVAVSESVTLAVTSITGEPKPDIIVQTLSNESIQFSNLYAGQYSLSVASASSYFVLPAPVTFFVKYALSFVNPPSVLKIGQNFIIQVNPSDTLPPTFTSTTIGLFCNSQLVQSWLGVPYNQQVSLQLSNSVSTATGCTLTTISIVSDVFIPATTTVSIEYKVKSPFGGNLFSITETQLVAFLSQFGTGWNKNNQFICLFNKN